MSHRFYPILLQKPEWERLKRQGGPLIAEKAVHDSREEYFDHLNEQSRKWISFWPDSAEGVREKLKEQRRKQRKENMALLDWFKKSRKPANTKEAVQRAKQIIFDDSCYGRQLISSIIESNVLEEREAQIEFQKEIKKKEAELEKGKTYNDSPLVSDVDNNRRLAALECVKFNEEMERTKKERAAKLKAEKNKSESVDEDMIKQIRGVKAKKKAEIKLLQKKELEEYEAVRKEIAKHRKITEDHDNALIAVYKEEQGRIKCKVKAVLKKITEENRYGERAEKFYKVIDEIQKTETKRYDDFVEKGLQMHEERCTKEETKKIETENKRRAEICKIAEENKIAAEQHKLYIELTAPVNKCACDVQTLLVKPDAEKQLLKKKKVQVKTGSDKRDVSEKDLRDDSQKSIERECSEDKLSFLKPRNKLVEALRRRAKESSGYTGTDATDKYFAQQASDALKRTKHKYFARKVVDEYLKKNGLKASDLSISNY